MDSALREIQLKNEKYSLRKELFPQVSSLEIMTVLRSTMYYYLFLLCVFLFWVCFLSLMRSQSPQCHFCVWYVGLYNVLILFGDNEIIAIKIGVLV